ncbi:MAG: DEAD/DEAH box helicase [Alphaproteobacteria bacterium]
MSDFEFLGLAPETMRAVNEAGYTTPTPIQAQAIPSVLMGKDIMGIAQTGTGKTASFTLPMIDILAQGRARARMPRSLILEPTRELAAQVAENFEIYGKYHKLNMALLIGGVSFDDQVKKLDRGVDVLIATPGRLLDHFERGKLMLSGVDILVCDEADRMLDMGFIPDVERICSLMPQKHQTLFFSATMPKEIKRLADQFLKDPKLIEVASPASTADNVAQFLCTMKTSEARAKRDKLREIIEKEDVKNAIIFCNRKRDVDVLFRSLKKHGFSAAALHGDLDQSVRTDVLASFKDGSVRLLIASDVAARGLDIPAVSHVFNFDVPSHAEDYIHRIGRTGRAGLSGRAFTLTTPADDKWLKNVHDLIGKKIDPMESETPSSKPASKPDDSPRAESDDRPPKRRRRKADSSRKDDAGDKPKAKAQDSKQQPEEAKPEENRRQPRERKSRRSHDDNEPVVGMGDHVPAFMMQSVAEKAPKKKSRRKKTPEAA